MAFDHYCYAIAFSRTFKNYNGNIDAKDRNNGLAFFVQVSPKNLSEARRLMRKIYRPAPFAYAVHIDARISEKNEQLIQFLSDYKSVNNVRFMEPRRYINYRGVSMLLNTLDGITLLLQEFQHWHHVFNLSGSDYPLIDLRAAERILGSCGNEKVSFIPLNIPDALKSSLRGRFTTGHNDPALSGHSADDVGSSSFAYRYRGADPTFKIRKGEAWVTLLLIEVTIKGLLFLNFLFHPIFCQK